MINIIILIIAFSVTTVLSVLLLGSRDIIANTMNFYGILKVIFSWQFILGAFFAFFSRLLFMLINSALYKIPELSASSTTITAFITSVSLVFIVIANYYFLGERFSLTQGIGAFAILLGIFLITK